MENFRDKTEEELKNMLGRNATNDSRDVLYPMKAVIPKGAPESHYKYYWNNGWWGNQENTPQCVAYSWIHLLEDGSVTQNARPAPILDPVSLYNECQQNDEWAGTAYDGTSVRAGAKVLQAKGFIKEYRWGYSIDELIQCILKVGPAVIGTNWYYNMFFPNSKGEIFPKGDYMGGHAYLVNGVNVKKKIFRIKNSWGKEWGKNGSATISFKDMEFLISKGAEICVATEVRIDKDEKEV